MSRRHDLSLPRQVPPALVFVRAQARPKIEKAAEAQATAKLLGVRKLPTKRSWAVVSEGPRPERVCQAVRERRWMEPRAQATSLSSQQRQIESPSSCSRQAPQDKEFEVHLLSRVRRWRHARRALALDVMIRFAKEPTAEIRHRTAIQLRGNPLHTCTCLPPRGGLCCHSPPQEKLDALTKEGRPLMRRGRPLTASKTWAWTWLLAHGYTSKRKSTKRSSTPEAPRIRGLHRRPHSANTLQPFPSHCTVSGKPSHRGHCHSTGGRRKPHGLPRQACVVALRKFTHLLRAVVLSPPALAAPHAAAAPLPAPVSRPPQGPPAQIVAPEEYGRYPLSVQFNADQVPFNLDNASSTTFEAPGQPAAVAAPTGSDKRFGTLQV